MVFDKTKAMRNAERHLAQGKIRSAISEYKQVVDNDPRDFGTMNMLGDLYIKASEPKAAVHCYLYVADHYSKQGFAQKAIAVYNKVSKIQPNSLEVAEKLAELYKVKGSISEAKSHYVMLAENYQQRGRMIEALAMWKQIAILDPNNTEVYLTLAESFLKENQFEESVEAFIEAGARLARVGQHDASLNAYSRALDIQGSNQKALTAFVSSKFAVGRADEAASKLESILVKEPFNRDVQYLLINCHMEAGNVVEAEKAVIKLVEQEPANYPKFLELANIYLKLNDLESASRVLTMSSEHLLVGGQADDFAEAVQEVLSRDHEQLDGNRLWVRFCTWQRDEGMLRDSLIRLAEVAKRENSVEDERFVLSQLVMIMPHEVAYAARLKEINQQYGFEDETVGNSLFDKQFLKETINDGSFAIKNNSMPVKAIPESDFAIVGATIETSIGTTANVDFPATSLESTVVEDEVRIIEPGPAFGVEPVVDESPAGRLRKEADSIIFYIDSGYTELAEKAINELRGEFGEVPEIEELRAHLKGEAVSVPAASNGNTAPNGNGSANGFNAFDIGAFRNELGLEENDAADDSDYDTHYHTAVAYQEMGLLEQAIAEFQDAINLVRPNDGTRRFFHCANLLGHCFMQNGMPKLALKWHQRTLETTDLSADEKQAVWYELGAAYEAEGDLETAGKYFEQVYTENVDFRDVRSRLKNMTVSR